MKRQKFLAIVLCLVMAVSLCACASQDGNSDQEAVHVTATPTVAPTLAPVIEEVETPEPTVAPAVVESPSINFEDGSLSFLGLYKGGAIPDDSALEIADFNGSKALKVTRTNEAYYSYVGFDMWAMLGEKAADVATIKMVLGTTHADGNFYAMAGTFLNLGLGKEEAWSVYMEKKNPKVAEYTVPEDGAFSEENYQFIVTFKEDKGAAGSLYIDDIAFLDAAGNTIAADTTAVYTVAETGSDRSNLYNITDAVEFAGFTTSGGAWAQNGIEPTAEFMDALVPGSVIEIEYSSQDGNIWMVWPWAAAGWSRVGDGTTAGNDHTFAYMNKSRGVAQITYEQIAAICGEDKSTWGAMVQCEGSSDWEVYSMKVGKASEQFTLVGAVELAGFQTSGSAWGQNGIEPTAEFMAALVPGSVIEIEYSSQSGELWMVWPWAAAGWSRVGDGNFAGNGHDAALCIDGKCYVTYEQIAAICGEDTSTWGAMVQCEASSDWEVYSMKVGSKAIIPASNSEVELAGFQTSGSAWGQNGIEPTAEFMDALVPGSYVKVEYSSQSGELWLVWPWAAAGWMRVGDGNFAGNGHSYAACVNGVAYISYEQIAELCGEDKSTWGAMLQCEASSDWEVYSVSVVAAK